MSICVATPTACLQLNARYFNVAIHALAADSFADQNGTRVVDYPKNFRPTSVFSRCYRTGRVFVRIRSDCNRLQELERCTATRDFLNLAAQTLY